MIAGEGEEIVEKVVTMAKEGDKDALKWCLDRLVPRLKSEEVPSRFPMKASASLAEIGKAVLRAASTGKLSAHQAQLIFSVLADQAHLIETTELEARMTKVEQDVRESAT